MTSSRRLEPRPFVRRHIGAAVPLLALFLLYSTEASGAEIGGSWESLLRVDWEASATELEGELEFCVEGTAWEAEATVEFDPEGWKKLEVEAGGELPGFELGSKLTFDPRIAEFKKLALDLALESHGWEIDIGLDLYSDHCWADLRAQVELDTCEIDIKTRLGASKAFSLDFYRTDIEISFETCGVPVDVETRFTAKKGFERIDVEAVFPLPPFLSWVEVEIDTRLTSKGKKTTFEPELDAAMSWEGLTASIELFGEVVAYDPLVLDGLAFVGAAIDIACDSTWVKSRTSFDPALNKSIVGDKAYAQAVGTGYEAEGGCDRSVSVEAWAYAFEVIGPFDWDRSALVLAVEPVGSWEFELSICFESGSIAETALEVDIEW